MQVFRFTKIRAKERFAVCTDCSEQIKTGYKVTINGKHHCDKCVISGFLANKGLIESNLFARLKAAFSNREIEVERFVEKGKGGDETVGPDEVFANRTVM